MYKALLNIKPSRQERQPLFLSNGASDVRIYTPTLNEFNMFYVYILRSKKDQDLYIGSTNDLRERFQDHNSGRVFSTRHRAPFELIYYEAYKNEKDARKREHNLKLRANALTQLKRRLRNSLNPHTYTIGVRAKTH